MENTPFSRISSRMTTISKATSMREPQVEPDPTGAGDAGKNVAGASQIVLSFGSGQTRPRADGRLSSGLLGKDISGRRASDGFAPTLRAVFVLAVRAAA
jgi:hypothetical protein